MNTLGIVSMLVVTAAVVCTTQTAQSDTGGLDEAGSKAIREMMARLDQVLMKTQPCNYKYGEIFSYHVFMGGV